MEQAEITGQLQSLIEGHRVVSSVITSYTVELDFFELDVIPLMLSGKIAYSMDERVKAFQVSEALRQADVRLEIFCDWRMFRQGESRSPRMEYLCHRVDLGNHAFHPKVNWLLLESDTADEQGQLAQRLVMGVGSNNLTRAGWWENLEVQHWEVITPGSHDRAILNEVLADLSYLKTARGLQDGTPGALPGHRDAIAPIERYLQACAPANKSASLHYYGISRSQSVPAFLAQHLPTQEAELLEIISPFFAEDGTSQLEQRLHAHRSAHLFLPVEEEHKDVQHSLCSTDYLTNIQKRNGIDWCDWKQSIDTRTPQERLRVLHAKLFHFQFPEESWFFIGSVNFTYKALHDNAEAGFLLKQSQQAPLLKPLEGDPPPPIQKPLELPPGTEEAAGNPILARPVLLFDWQHNKLFISVNATEGTKEPVNWQLDINNHAGDRLVTAKVTGDETIALPITPTQPLRHHLEHSGFVIAELVGDIGEGQAALQPPLEILVQQINWAFKPQDLPKLTPQEILAIYAGLPEQRRQALLEQAQLKQVLAKYGATEYTASPEFDNPHSEFFCEYAQIFQSFQALTRNIDHYHRQDALHQIDYYLTGQGVDSLPALIAAACYTSSSEPNTRRQIQTEGATGPQLAELPGVTAYLILLCSRELLSKHQDHTGAPALLKKLNSHLDELKSGPRLQFENEQRRWAFIEWFEEMFSKPVILTDADKEPTQ